ncbi:NYN domain-containing protein [Halobacteriovorax sp. GB3]|uniref:NYN domain-containing protein n=1 Tax=Halobacteriovorax sp. GB3 TaxID=2719615 RepID=UPI00235EB039|nr:NYN domain-containing protein [Halobacteriovorax sp. GB3]MDD0852091.1 NYN domain-containing protein [Halobacteriovorax sp. GB3]
MSFEVLINQSVAILVDGNNIERSIHTITNSQTTMVNFDTVVPRLLDNRGLNRLIYFREGKNISSKLRERLHNFYHGSVIACHKSADIPLTIKATQLASKVDSIIIMSGDSDYVELVRHLKGEGVRVEIAAIEETTSRVLIEEADYFHPILESDIFELPSQQRSNQRSNQRSSQKKTQKKGQNKKKAPSKKSN